MLAAGAYDDKSVSSYSAMLHPNEDPSEISYITGLTPNQTRHSGNPRSKQHGRVKRMFIWVDEWLKPLLINKSLD